MIEFKNVSKIYKKTNITALNTINFRVEKEDSICLLGPNGAGKTTLIKCLCGLNTPSEGDIYIQGQPIHQGKVKSDISVVLEGARNLYWRVSVKRNLYYFGSLMGRDREFMDNQIEKYEHIFNLKPLLGRKVHSLSLGQKQKISIACSILLEPGILILDEPSNGLDIQAKEELANLLNDTQNNTEGVLIMASHDVDFARKIVDKFLIINEGEIKDIMMNNDLTNELICDRYHYIMKA